MISSVRLAALFFFVVIAGASPVLAATQTVLFNSLDASDSATGSATIIWGPDPAPPPPAPPTPPYPGQSAAAAFTVTGGDFAFQSAEFVLASNATSGNVRVRLFTDNAGLPGSLLETIDYTGALTPFGDPVTILFASTVHPILAEDTTYWLAVSFHTEAHNAYLSNNSVGLDIAAAGELTNSGDWFSSDGIDPAFRVIGVVPESVPEPASALLLTMGALALVRRRRR